MKKEKNKQLTIMHRKEGKSEVVAIVFFAFAFLILLSLLSSGKVGYVGVFGEFLAKYLLRYLGGGSYFLPLLVFVGGISIFKREKIDKITFKIIGVLLFLIGSCSLFSFFDFSKVDGGVFGEYFSKLLVSGFGYMGSYILFTAILVISIILTTGFSLIGFLNKQPGRVFIYVAKKAKVFFSFFIKEKNLRENKRDIKIGSSMHSDKSSSYQFFNKKEKFLNDKKSLPEENKKGVFKDFFSSSRNSSQCPIEYKLPSLDFLVNPSTIKTAQKEEDLKENAFLLEKTLNNFDIKAKVVQVNPGPIITRYEIELAPGVKVSRILNLSNDIALTMKSGNVRILAPIPGKAAVGIEIPNLKSSFVGLKRILMTDRFRNASSKLTIGLGLTVAGIPYLADLSSMPHLLIAGATGSGKSIGLKTIITSILYKAKPDEVKFILIDPKRLELSIYDGIPHLYVPVICKAKQATLVLRALIKIMEERYEKFSKKMVRDIESYNKLAAKSSSVSGEGDKECYLVIVIDELADLMMVSSREVEESIIRLSQMGRAVGIHLILATQRPSVNVITGLIKANLPSRIAFQVLSKIDSRVILDVNGAENLIGKGDMLFLPSGSSNPIRLQGAFVSDEESKRIIKFIKANGKPDYNFNFLHTDHKQCEKKEKDSLFDEAVNLVIKANQASTSFLQRKLGIGYIRAAKLIDSMEEDGIISSLTDNTKSRKILIDKNDYKQDQ